MRGSSFEIIVLRLLLCIVEQLRSPQTIDDDVVAKVEQDTAKFIQSQCNRHCP